MSETPVNPVIRNKLAALKRALLAHLVGRAAAWLVTVLVGGVFLTLALDRLMNLTRGQRALFVLLSAAALGYALWWFLLRPLRVRMSSQELALVLEQHYPALADRLISTLQLAGQDVAALGASPVLVERVAEQAADMAGGLDPSTAVAGRRTARRLGMAGLALALLSTLWAFQPGLMNLWFQRNILFRDIPWPRETRLTVEGAPDFVAGRGRNFSVRVTADPDGVVPAQVLFHIEYRGKAGEATLPAGPTTPDGNVFEKVFESVIDEFDFYVTGHDGRSPERGTYHVRVVDEPEVVEETFQALFPPYMNQPELQSVPAAQGVVSLPAGSTVTLTGRTNKNVTQAQMFLEEAPAGELAIHVIDVEGGPAGPRLVKGTFQLPEKPDKGHLRLRVALHDTEGRFNDVARVYAIQIRPDNPPTVSLNRRAVRGDITAKAVIPLVLECRDDVSISGIEVTADPVAYVGGGALAESAPATAPAPAPATVRKVAAVENFPRNVPTFVTGHDLDIASMNLVPGQLLRLQAKAADSLPGSFGGPNYGESSVQTFKIVTEDELLEELMRRMKEYCGDLDRAIATQAQARDTMRVLRDRLTGAGAVDAESQRLVGLGARDQERTRDQCVVIAQQIQAVVEEMEANKAGQLDVKAKFRAGADLLASTAKNPMEETIQTLHGASKQTDAAILADQAAAWDKAMDGYVTLLQELRKQLADYTDRQMLVKSLRGIIDFAKEVERGIKDAAREGLPTTAPATNP